LNGSEVEYMVAQGEYVKAGDFVDNWVQGPFLEQFSADIYVIFNISFIYTIECYLFSSFQLF
jgi:hypothetical protein